MKKRKSKNKIAGYIIKALLCFIMISWIAGIIFRIINGGQLEVQRKIDTFLAVTLILPTIFIVILSIIFPNAITIPQKVKPYKFNIIFENYNDIVDYIDKNIYKIKYKKYEYNKYKNSVIYYKLQHGTLEFFMILDFDKFSNSNDEMFDYIDDHIRSDFINDMKKYYDYNFKDKTYLIENYLFITNKETEKFMSVVSTNTVGGYRQSMSFSGYSLDSKSLYVSRQKDGQITNYLYARRKFLKVMNLKMKDRIKG